MKKKTLWNLIGCALGVGVSAVTVALCLFLVFTSKAYELIFPAFMAALVFAGASMSLFGTEYLPYTVLKNDSGKYVTTDSRGEIESNFVYDDRQSAERHVAWNKQLDEDMKTRDRSKLDRNRAYVSNSEWRPLE